MSWKIVIERGNLGFAAAHFITFGGLCEPLHGHNYGVSVELVGALTQDSYVFDFVALKDITRALCKAWDHRFLLPLQNPSLRLNETEREWEIIYTGAGRAPAHSAAPRLPGLEDAHTATIRYVMPKETVVALPIDNVTAERLAQLLAADIVTRLTEDLATMPDALRALERLTVGVAETEMQTAYYTRDLRNPDHDST
ncbi:MAG TPA: 6-carboxytetrahydropterin synthase [Ktedonobacterales bacterium]|nr:6-carboxytetrahydropterin synthase [Ktedonobacterales bacterium]